MQSARVPRAVVRTALPLALVLVLGVLAAGDPEGTGGAGDRVGAMVAAPVSSARPPCRLGRQLLVPRCGGRRVLTGAYVHPRAGEGPVAALRRFERATRAPAQIVHHYHRGDDRFPSRRERVALRSGDRRRLLLANWKPDTGTTWRAVAEGRVDHRLRAQARHLRRHWRRPMFLAVHHEPENDVRPWPGSGFEATDYRAMYRRVVDVFEAAGVRNVRWVLNYMGFEGWALEPWFGDLFPGRRYVDWLAYDPYLTEQIGGQRGRFHRLVNQSTGRTRWRGFYRWAVRNHPRKPIMLAEWGVQEKASDPTWKGRVFRQAPRALGRYPQLRALVYFDHPRAGPAGDVSVSTSRAGRAGFRAYLRSDRVANIG